MNPILRNVLDRNTPKFNSNIMNGLATKMLEKITTYLDNVIKSALVTLDKDLEFEYLGYRHLTPEEDFKTNINTAYSKNEVDITKNYLFKIEFIFRYKNSEIRKTVSLPFVERGGALQLSSADYLIVPVLSQYPIAPEIGGVFIRLLRDKLNIKKMERVILINGEKHIRPIIYGNIFKLQNDKNINKNPPIMIYLLIKWGFFGLFKHYFNTEPIVLIGNDKEALEEGERLRKEGYIEYTTTGQKPRIGILRNLNYIPHEVKIYVKKKDVNSTMESLITGLIYLFDIFPTVTLNLKDVLGKKKEPNTQLDPVDMDDETRFWVILLGKYVFNNNYTPIRILEDMTEHINILNGYLDNIIKEKLEEKNIYVEDFFELLFYAVDHFNELTMFLESHLSDINNRYIEILYYILFDFIVSINKAFLELQRTAAKGKLSEKEAARIFTDYITPKKIFNLIKAGQINIAVMPNNDYSGDNYYWKMTSILED